MKNVILDFESYYDKAVSVVGMGVPNYVRAADAYCVGVVDTESGEAACGTLKEMGPMIEQMAKDSTVQPVAANSNFDQAWEEKYWPSFINDWYCVLDHGASCQHPRNLAGLSYAALGEKVDKGVRDEMLGKRFEELPKDDQDKVINYCLNDCIKTAEILQKLPPMSSFESRVAAHTRAINRRGVFINIELVEQDKTRLERMRHDAFRKIPWHTDSPPLSYQALVRYCNARNLPVPKSLAKTDEETTDLIATVDELKEVIGTMRSFRRANTMLKKIETLQERVTPDSILPLDLLYCGAPHTRRWSSKGVNVQNLDKEALDVGHGETVWSRRWIVPRPGKVFYVIDLAQIEPRCLNWLAGNEEMMEALRHGYSIYESFAIMAEGWRGEPGTIKTELGKKKYTLLKNRVLGLGYGMGSSKFENYVKQNGGEISTDESEKIVKDFRAKNQSIVKFWRRLDNLIASSARDKEKILALELPTGEFLKHFNVRSKGGAYESFTVKGDFTHMSHQPRLWGGTLTENVTQRMARDVLANAIINLEDAGLHVAFHVHDEVILELDDDASKDEAAKEAHKIMTTAPEWASDLPLGAEGAFAESYTK